MAQKGGLIANLGFKLQFCISSLFEYYLTLAPAFGIWFAEQYPVGKSCTMLLIEVFTLFTVFTLFFDGAGGRFECKNLFVKVLI